MMYLTLVLKPVLFDESGSRHWRVSTIDLGIGKYGWYAVGIDATSVHA